PVQTEETTESTVPTETVAAAAPAEPPTTQAVTDETDPPETEATYKYVPTAATPSRLPCNGEILQEYSNGELVKSVTTGVWQTHNGIDIAADPGDPVYPMDPGVVMTIEEDALWGVCVTIDHKNGIYSKYCGLHPGLSVTEGDAVTNTEPIGNVGNMIEVENALPSHLHFELRQGDVLINPIAYLSDDVPPTETTQE
ncbi:MAG: M23 family metallopeptidase, partial [Oscillospiraceae bacterium]|nr:M23 family metallopeptidase [Oscillospiraceae bacterium]